mgnify:CR=1 FL=1
MPRKSKLKTLKTVETLTHDKAPRKHIPITEYLSDYIKGGAGTCQCLTRNLELWHG